MQNYTFLTLNFPAIFIYFWRENSYLGTLIFLSTKGNLAYETLMEKMKNTLFKERVLGGNLILIIHNLR